jgi:Aspartate/tyrosine/aromatic aminotransferase
MYNTSLLEFYDMPYHAQYISNFTDNHPLQFRYSGFKDIRNYRYWDPASRSVDFRGLLEDIEEAPEDSVIVLHMTAHNPTGCDLTQEQWEQIADVMEVCLLYLAV